MAAVALICMTMTSAILAACGSDEKTEIKSEKVCYSLTGATYRLPLAMKTHSMLSKER